MRNNHLQFSVGKLRYKYLKNMLKEYVSNLEKEDKRLILGSKIGEDAAVIDMGENYLVAKTDPITFATDEIGYYVVNVNVNDVVCTGATPKWFQSTVLLPENKTSEDLIEKIFKGVHDTCKSMNITVVGGHTEITPHLNRPIVIGSLLGEVEKEKLVSTSGAKSEDAIILTKGIFIEGTSIIAREKENLLKEKGYKLEFIDRCKKYLYNPGISVFKEALLANKNFQINSMHDPTEGGLNTGIAEMGMASNLGVVIEKDKIKILPEPLELSKIFNINPLGTISSGSLLISIDKKNSLELIELMKKNDIDAEIIGEFNNKKHGFFMVETNGRKKLLNFSEIDEITKIF